MAWFDRNNTNSEPGGTQKEPQLTDEQFERIATEVAKKIEKPLTDGLATASAAALEGNPILKRLKDTMDANDEAAKKKKEASTTTQQHASNKEFAEAYENLDDDTKKVIDARFNSVQQSAMRTDARETRRSVFEDEDNFPYYAGDIKRKVDEMIEAEPLVNQTNPLVVRNCYKIVMADHLKELQEGKLRSRLSNATGSSTSTTSQIDPNALPSLTDDEKKTAKNLGISETDWAKTKKDLITEGMIGV